MCVYFLECLAPVTFPVFSNFLCVWWGHTYNISRILYNTALAFTPCFLRSLGSASYKSLGLSEVPLGMYIVLHICIFFWIPWHRLGLFKVPSDHLSPHSPTFLLWFLVSFLFVPTINITTSESWNMKLLFLIIFDKYPLEKGSLYRESYELSKIKTR